jgi:hypothetical protein
LGWLCGGRLCGPEQLAYFCDQFKLSHIVCVASELVAEDVHLLTSFPDLLLCTTPWRHLEARSVNDLLAAYYWV